MVHQLVQGTRKSTRIRGQPAPAKGSLPEDSAIPLSGGTAAGQAGSAAADAGVAVLIEPDTKHEDTKLVDTKQETKAAVKGKRSIRRPRAVKAAGDSAEEQTLGA